MTGSQSGTEPETNKPVPDGAAKPITGGASVAEPGSGGRLQSLYRRHGNAVWTLGDQLMVSGVNFLTIAAIARALGLEGFGLFNWGYLVFLLFKSIHLAVIVAPMMSIGPKQRPEDEGAYFGTIVVHQAGLAALTALLIPLTLAAFVLIDPEIDLRHMALPLIAAAVGDQVQDMVRRYLFTKHRPIAAFLNDVIAFMVRLVLLFALPFGFGVDLDGSLVFWIMGGTSLAAAAVGAFWIQPLRFERVSLIRVSRTHWDFSKWLFGTAVMQFCSGHAIVMVAGIVLGAAALGGIRATLNILAPIQVLTLALQNIAPVHASAIFKDHGIPAMKTYLYKVTGVGVAASLAIVVAGVFFAEDIVRLMYGEEFVPYAWLVNWWAIIFTIRYLQFPLEVGLRSIEFTRPLFVTIMIEAVFGLGSAYFLASWFGIQGTMFGLAIAHIIPVTVLSILLFRRLNMMERTGLMPASMMPAAASAGVTPEKP